MTQFSMFDVPEFEPKDEPKDFEYDAEISDYVNYKNGNYICLGIVLDRKNDGLYARYRIRAARDKPGSEYYGYSIQWIWDFQLI